MQRLRDLSTEAYLHLPRIEPEDVRLLWHADFWDVPVSGMLLYQGKKHWFQTREDIRYSESANVVYLVLELTDEQLKEEEYWHELFRRKVGTHTDYDEHGHRDIGGVKPQSNWSEFYNAYKHRKPRDFSNNIVVGWLGSL